MKRKIILSLLTVFLFSALGGYCHPVLRNTTATLSRLIDLYQIEGHRNDLVIATQTVQSDLTTAIQAWPQPILLKKTSQGSNSSQNVPPATMRLRLPGRSSAFSRSLSTIGRH